MNRSLLMTVGIVSILWPSAVFGQENALTLEEALERARRRAPGILVARDRIAEARGRLVGASILLQDNPVFEVFAGQRGSSLGEGPSLSADFGVSQRFELGGRRKIRTRIAEADVEREIASSEDTARQLLGEAAIAFLRGLAAQEQVRLATTASGNADELLRSVQRRYELGDVPVLEVNLARTTSARARSDVYAAQSGLASALADLRVFLGMGAEEPVAVTGELRGRHPPELNEILQRAVQRADLRALAAELRQAEAEVSLGEAYTRPDLGVGFRYEREEKAHVARGGVTLTLPIFARGQDLRATGQARAARLRRELEAGQRVITAEVQGAWEALQHEVRAADELARNAVTSLEENELLARRSYEEGEISLAELLLVRRDAFEIRLLYVQRSLQAAVAEIEVEARSGVLR